MFGKVRHHGRRRGNQGRLNFGIVKLNATLEKRLDTLQTVIGQEDMEAFMASTELTPETLKKELVGFSLLDTIFYCGENTKMMLLEYITLEGILATRLCEFYSFRRAKMSGNILMYAWSHRDRPGGIRSYRLERVVSVTPTLIPYEPRWDVEILNP